VTNKEDRNVDSEKSSMLMRLLFRMNGYTVYFKTEEKKEKGGEREREGGRTDKNLCSAEGELSSRNKEPRGTTKRVRWGEGGGGKKPSKQQQNTTGSPERTLGECQHST